MAKTGRPKIANSKKNRLHIRMTDEQVEKLEYCSKVGNMTKTEVIMLGIDKVYQELIKKN